MTPLFKDGVLQRNCTAKANILNDQFVSVFTNEDTSSLDHQPSQKYQSSPSTLRVSGNYWLSWNHSLPLALTTSQPTYWRKEQMSWRQLCLSCLKPPSIKAKWKSADVSPIFKRGDKHRAENYRPISLTSIICKLLEHVIHGQIMHHLDAHGLLTDKHFGFRKKRSCESQLLITVNDLAEGLRDKEQVDAILLDFSKAFDRVPHERLFLKLHHLGVHGVLLYWIRDFLSESTQQVVLEGKKSYTSNVTSGVPQGTVLGPLLFLVFINDMPDTVSSNIRLFADDTLLYRFIKTNERCCCSPRWP